MDSSAIRALVVTADERLRDAVLAAAAAAGVEPQTAEELGESAVTGALDLVVVGLDRTQDLAGCQNLGSARIQLVGHPEDAAALCAWSATLDASVTLLPDQLRQLTGLFTAGVRDRAQVVTLVGGSGGVGTSTLAAALGVRAVTAGHRAALVDLDQAGGGADLLLGVEDQPGWRWPVLARASGFLGEVQHQLPQVDGLPVLAQARTGEAEPGPEAVAAVLRSLGRDHELVLVDAGRLGGAAAVEAVRRSARVLVVCRDEVTSLAAAGRLIGRLDTAVPLAAVVRGHGSSSDAEVADLLGIPVWERIADDRSLVRAAAWGEVPGRGGGRRWRRSLQGILDRVLEVE